MYANVTMLTQVWSEYVHVYVCLVQTVLSTFLVHDGTNVICIVESARSPWSNKYDPPLSDGAVPSDRLRRLEVEANQAFDTYREL